jgi:hypothetical protein
MPVAASPDSDAGHDSGGQAVDIRWADTGVFERAVPRFGPSSLACSIWGTRSRVRRWFIERIVVAFTRGACRMSLLISVLITFVVVLLVLYLVNMLPIDGRAKQIIRIVVIIIGVLSLLRPLMY